MSREVDRRPGSDPVSVDADSLPVLQLEDIDHESDVQLRARGVAYTREYHRIEGAQTVLLKNIATVILAFRKRHDDWLGRSYEYRQEVAEMYRATGIPAESLEKVQASVRYHVGNLLRRQLTPRELKALELLDTSPMERTQDRRAVNAAILTASRLSSEAAVVQGSAKGKLSTKEPSATPAERIPEQGSAIKATADHLRLTTAARQLVDQLNADVIKEHMTEGQRSKMDDELAAMQAEIARLRRLTRKR